MTEPTELRQVPTDKVVEILENCLKVAEDGKMKGFILISDQGEKDGYRCSYGGLTEEEIIYFLEKTKISFLIE